MFRFFARVVLCTSIRAVGLPGGIANLSSTIDCGDQQPYLVVEYIERSGACLDGSQLAEIRLVDEAKEIPDVRFRPMCDTAVGAWIKRWLHWGGRGAVGSTCHYQDTDSPFVRSFEKVAHERRIGDILRHLGGTYVPSWPRSLPELIRFAPP